MGGFIFDVGLLGPCGKHAEEAEDLASMPRTLQSMPRTLRSMPRKPRMLPSMPRSCQASLHILGSYIKRVPQGPRSPTSKIKPPTCFLISCEAKGVVYHQVSISFNVGT